MTRETRYIDRAPVGDWGDHAACKGQVELFYPGAGYTAKGAIALCDRCPVRSECLDHALDNYECYGIWAGTTHGERIAIGYRRNPQQVFSVGVFDACGTDAGYKRHRRVLEDPCDECRRAHNDKNSDRYHLRRHGEVA